MSIQPEPIAIIGASCRFAGGASSPSKLWDLILHPRDLSAPPSHDRFNLSAFHHQHGDRHGQTNVCGSYFLEQDPRTFDAAFFNISPKEAEAIDPQHRMLLEVTYEAIESAGLTLQGLQGSDTSVYVGLMIRDYMDIQARDPDYFSQYMVTGTSSALNANRVSYFFDWRGPSMTIDTACSSGLVAVHQAVQGLRSGESRVACVAGTNLLLGPELFISAAKMRMLSPRSRMWDASAEGYARGDGVATLVLKTLRNAIEDGDHIEAIIRQTGVNSDGRTRGITLPNPEAQTALIRKTYKEAVLDLSRDEDRPQYFEAHGTGTQAGDPLEASAIHEAFFGQGVLLDRKTPMWVGSIKTVVGHTEGTAGLAGMLKVILAMKHRVIPPNLHFREWNPRIASFGADLRVPTEPVPWPRVRHGVPLRASVNSFGFGGTNAHVILENFEMNDLMQPDPGHASIVIPILLSAQTEKALQIVIADYCTYLKTHGASVRLRDLAHTLRKHRSVFPFKTFFTGTSIGEIAAQMDDKIRSGKVVGSQSKTNGGPCLLGIFTGQGAHWPGMGRHLIEKSRLFGETIDNLENILSRLPDAPAWSLRGELLAPESASRLSEAAISQPLCTAIAIALVDLLRASGVTFSAVVGHSSGEIGAAYAAGVINAAEAIRIAYYRGVHAKLAGTKNGIHGKKGGMIAVGTDLGDAKRLCGLSRFAGRLQIAASNSPSSVTLSGDLDAILEAKEYLDLKGIFARQLRVDTAYHSFHMLPCAEPYMASLRACEVRAREPLDMDCVWISSVHGSEGTPTAGELGAKYWRDNMVETVRFSEAVERAWIECGPFDLAIEVGPHPALKGPVTKIVRECLEDDIPYVATLERQKNDTVSFGEALASLWMRFGSDSVNIDGYVAVSELAGLAPPKLVKDHLPSYPWDHSQLLWRESRLSREYRLRTSPCHQLLGNQVPGGGGDDRLSWRNILILNEVPWINHYRVHGGCLVPTSAACLIVMEAGRRLASASGIIMDEIDTIEIQSLEFVQAIPIPDSLDGVELITSIQRLAIDGRDAAFAADVSILFGPPDGTRQLQKAVSGRVVLCNSPQTSDDSATLCQTFEDNMDSIEADELYATLRETGLEYHGPFQMLQQVRRRWRLSTARLRSASDMASASHIVDPFLLESCVQGAFAAFAAPRDTALWSCFLPTRIQRLALNLRLLPACEDDLEMCSRIVERTDNDLPPDASFNADVEIMDRSGRAMIELEGLHLSCPSNLLADTDRGVFDREVFLQTVWKSTTIQLEEKPTQEEILEAGRALEERADCLQARHGANASPQTILAELFQDFTEGVVSPRTLFSVIVEQHPLFVRSNRAIRNLAESISHRFANLNVLEIGLSCLGPSRALLDGLTTNYSYTFASTTPPQNCQGDARFVSLADSRLSRELLTSTFEHQELDVVVFSHCLYDQSPETLQSVLSGLYHILKPGGFLLIVNLGNDYAWSRLFLRGLLASAQSETPGDIGIPLTVPLPAADLNQALRQSGFGGIEAQLPALQDPCGAVSVVISQALDEKADLMRHPLQPSAMGILSGSKLLVIGGRTAQTRQIIRGIDALLSPWAAEIVIAESVLEMQTDAVRDSEFLGAIFLGDIDKPVVESLSPQTYEAISRIFKQAFHLLWVSSGSSTDCPGQAASAGIAQALSEQHLLCRAQHLDVDTLDSSETTIVSTFLRLLISSLPDHEGCRRLETVESQIVIRDGCEFLPRVLPIVDMNDRLNSRRREVKRDLPQGMPVSFNPRGSLHAVSYHAKPDRSVHHNPITVSHSLPFAIRVSEDTFMYLFVGTNDAQERVLGCSTTLSLPGKASAAWTIPEDTDCSCERLLELAASIVVARYLCHLLPVGESVVFEPSLTLAYLISDMTKGSNKKVRFITSGPMDSTKDGWIRISPCASKSVVQCALASRPKLFIIASGGSSRLVSRIQQILSNNTRVHDESEIFRLTSQTADSVTAETLTRMLTDAGLTALDALRMMPRGLSHHRLKLDDLLNGSSQPSGGLSIIDWTRLSSISVTIESLNLALLLSCHKTYALIEIEPQMLRSICHWLISCGVRSLLIIDRSYPEWAGQGLPAHVSVHFAQVDLSDAPEIGNLVGGFQGIAGVIYGAAGAHGSCTGDQTETIQVWKDVIRGSHNLSEALIVQRPEFFIMISSIDKAFAPVGTFLESLVKRGQSRGLAVSLVSLDAQWKAGDSSNDTPFMRISESDMHYVLTEAILIARSRIHDPVILAGMERINRAQMGTLAVWPRLSSPLFSHHLIRLSGHDQSSDYSRPKNLRERLAACSDEKTASLAIQEFFLVYLAGLLNLVFDNVRPEDGLASFGVDSLSASDIRAWFLKEVDADIPMITILGATAVAQLCDEAAAERTLVFEDRIVPAQAPLTERLPKFVDSNGGPWKSAVEMLDARKFAPESCSATPNSTEATSPFMSTDLSDSPTGEYFQIQRIERQSLNETRFWLPSQYLDQKTPFNCTTSYSLRGLIDTAQLEIAFKLLIQRHGIFRTAFFTDKSTGEPMQCILPSSSFALKVTSGNKGEDYEREFRRIQDYVFDLAIADTFVASIISHSQTEHTIITGYHHIIMDGVSWQITLRDLARFYESDDPELPPLTQYVDFAARQCQSISTGCYTQRMAYWSKEFPESPPVMPLFPFSKERSRKTLTSYDTRDVVVDLSTSLVSAIKKASLSAKSTSFHFYLAVFAVLSHRCLDITEMCLGIVDANRSDKSFLNTIGCFIDMLPLKLRVNKRERFNHTISSVRKKAYSALENSGVPLETMIRELQIPTFATTNPLFQVLINYRLGALRAPRMGDAEMQFLAYEDSKAPFDLTLSIDEKDDGTGMLTFSMHDYMFDRQGAELLVSTYVHLLEFLSNDASRRLNDIPLANETASRMAMAVGTGPVLDSAWPRSQTISQRVEMQIRKSPRHLAVKDLKGQSKTYIEMLRRIHALAEVFVHAGVTHDSRVAAYCEPSVDIVACILATHRVGAVFIPLDVRNSPERLRATVEECEPALILCDVDTKERVRGFAHARQAVLDITTVPESTDAEVPDVSRPSDGAIILYTSGSTGKPKGILLTQANLSIHCASISDKLGLTYQDVFLQQSALGFDAALGQMLYAMTSGGTLILGDNRGDPRDLAMLMETEKITFTLMIISEMTAMLQSARDVLSRCRSWRLALCGGEAFPGRLCSRFASLGLPDLMVFNAYGPTEGSIITSIGAVPYRDGLWGDDATIPCGPPLPDYGVYILDSRSRPVPVGWPGELCIAGPCVSSGYVGQPALTASKFRPFCLERPDGTSREGWNTIYRTGDRARMLDDGSFIFLGRIDGDTQVKLRGIRIELSEINNAIIRASGGAVTDAVTLVRGTTETDRMLVSFVLFARDVRENFVRDASADVYLRKLVQSLPLPTSMRPAVATALERFPITARGKLDTRALAAYELEEDMQENEDCFTETEQGLRKIWRAILPDQGRKMQIRKSSDFFSVGGNSLLMVRLRAAIRNEFEVDVSLAELFHASTLESLADRIESRSCCSRENAKLDWAKETALDATLPVARSGRRPTPISPGRPITVILTGSTGFLGREIVRQLIANPLVARVHCIAVRHGRTLPFSSDKIAIHNGDLSDRFLGLDEATALHLFSTASAIVHNGAQVSHMKSYQTLRATNVDSTKQLIELASRIPDKAGTPPPEIHYISSAGVGSLVGAPSFPEMSVSLYPPATDGSNGYLAAKYASERLLENASSRLGMRATIHRPSNISGPGVPERDIVHSVWRWSERMRAVPDFASAGAVGAFDFVDVGTCAAGIVGSLFEGLEAEAEAEAQAQAEACGVRAVRYLHQSGDRVTCFESFRDVLANQLGEEVAVLSVDEWIERAVGMGLDELVAGFLRQTRGALVMPLLVKQDGKHAGVVLEAFEKAIRR